jgi:hypothetical protein
MPRTDAELVKDVLRLGSEGGDYDDRNNPTLTPYITAANLLVTRVLTCATAKGVPLTDDEALVLETWLAAHGYALSDQPYAEKSTQRSKGVFQGRTGMRLEATKYGQMALDLDPSGCLAAVTKKQTVGMSWLGRTPTEQTDYLDRR